MGKKERDAKVSSLKTLRARAT
ncbi:TPA: hypothetical protein ANIA_11334 [Aspergillus nidulans FGSC A4]|uniref:Uncharacterized protein n=1 Tax=Emericella nidulans (strain FGSC A4 / ATCC 38163 / CBS 112.46 / NRRL 194 / M139) TaxID=227321 RepID=C8VNM1_EMENI|nr:TPA: hypothetical protein ANIA_11334 [Aspergillus nidulans FGSC A4]